MWEIKNFDIIAKAKGEITEERKIKKLLTKFATQVDFLEKSSEFFEKTKNLNGNERVKQYEALKKKTYGSFYDSIVSREDKFEHYQTELNLREKDFANLNEEQKQKEIRKLQEKYFGKGGFFISI